MWGKWSCKKPKLELSSALKAEHGTLQSAVGELGLGVSHTKLVERSVWGLRVLELSKD